MQRLEQVLAQTPTPNSAGMAKSLRLSQGHPKPAFSEKVQMGDQEKCFKNRPKRCHRWKGPKALWRRWHYPVILMHLKCKDWRRFRRERQLKKCPNGQVMAIFARSPKTRIFKNRSESSPCLNGLRALFRKWHYPTISMHLKCKDWRKLWPKKSSKSAREAKLWQFWQGHPKPAFSKKVQRGDQRIFFKNRLKSSRHLKGPEAL